MNELNQKGALVVGGSNGTGLAVAQLFLTNGSRVAITGPNLEELDDAITQIGHGVTGEICDVTKLENIRNTYTAIFDKFEKIDVLVISGTSATGNMELPYTEDMFDLEITSNLKSIFFSVQFALPYLNDGASVILTAASPTQVGLKRYGVYEASKAAINAFAKSLSEELVTRNIRVNVVSFGGQQTVTPMMQVLGENQPADGSGVMREMANHSQELPSAREVAGTYLFLASDASKNMVGAEIVFEGPVPTK